MFNVVEYVAGNRTRVWRQGIGLDLARMVQHDMQLNAKPGHMFYVEDSSLPISKPAPYDGEYGLEQAEGDSIGE